MNVERGDGCDRDRAVPPLRTAPVTAEAPADRDAAATLAARLAGHDFAHVLVFAAPEADLAALARDLAAALPGPRITGATTAGEIGRDGYAEGTVVAMGLPRAGFATASVVIRDLARLDADEVGRSVTAARVGLAQAAPDHPHDAAFLLCDGLSLREDVLTAALAPGLGGVPLFGGSAGDGARFASTRLLHDGALLEDAAVLTLMRTIHRPRVFSLDNLRPTAIRMVVTAADADRRVVREINAEPAAREYARLVGLDPEQLGEFAFAAHPVVVRLGDVHHVRAIQRVNARGELVFFSAIDEGMVLTVAEPEDVVTHTDRALAALAEPVAPVAILGCDCILRRVAAEREQSVGRLGATLARHGLVGFSTYGEQLGPMHLNQTLTGIAFYPPGKAR